MYTGLQHPCNGFHDEEEVFEHLITFDKEVTYIWQSPRWSAVKVLYIFVRYGTYVDVSLDIVVQCFPSLSSKICKLLYYVIICFLVTGMTAAEAILTLRVWYRIDCMGHRRILGKSVAFDLQDLLLIGGCIATGGRISLEASTWGLLLAYDTIMMVLMLPPAYYAYQRGGKSTMTNTVIRDGKDSCKYKISKIFNMIN
ncbi:hypothetical protein BDQ17DRAFT_1427677 [Cyathus striatus]|nr:hypothetical protein BDQ17DRAFT_1427677 [Cyathus striatus]